MLGVRAAHRLDDGRVRRFPDRAICSGGISGRCLKMRTNHKKHFYHKINHRFTVGGFTVFSWQDREGCQPSLEIQNRPVLRNKSKNPVLSWNGKHLFPYFHVKKKKHPANKVSLIYFLEKWKPCSHWSLCSWWNKVSDQCSLWNARSKLLTAKTCTSSAGCHAEINTGKANTFIARLSQQAEICFEMISVVQALQTEIIKPVREVITYE